MMRNLLLAIATGLVGAAVLHIVIVLALPAWTGKDAFSRAQELGETHRFFTLANEPNITGFYNDDPHIRSAVCRFDLSQDPVRIIARGNVALWMLSIFNTKSDEIYSMSDRSAIEQNVDLTLVTPAQMLQLRRNMPAALEKSVLVETDDQEGFVVLRAVAPDSSSERQTRNFLSEAGCLPLVYG